MATALFLAFDEMPLEVILIFVRDTSPESRPTAAAATARPRCLLGSSLLFLQHAFTCVSLALERVNILFLPRRGSRG
jgi:hypothetical protein